MREELRNVLLLSATLLFLMVLGLIFAYSTGVQSSYHSRSLFEQCIRSDGTPLIDRFSTYQGCSHDHRRHDHKDK